jgi:NAD(P)-dependent dehydrogenase (short-subunit alcohol dehydrogenase family)
MVVAKAQSQTIPQRRTIHATTITTFPTNVAQELCAMRLSRCALDIEVSTTRTSVAQLVPERPRGVRRYAQNGLYAHYGLDSKLKPMPSPIAQLSRSVAITGAGSGLGREIARGFAAKGYSVFGTALSEEEVQELKAASDGCVNLTIADMTMEAAVQAWAKGVTATLGDAGLDLLINNAGILTPGPIEVLPLEAIRHEFDVNVFGALSVINAFLPALRKAQGRIVQISTWTASVPLPFNGPSGASKAAMEVFSAVYRAELKSFGIDVVVAAAGNMKTGGPAKTASALARVAQAMTAAQRTLYGPAFASFTAKLNSMQSDGLDTQSAAARVIELAEQTPAPSRAAVGADSEFMLKAAREQTDAELDALRLQIVGLG